MGGQDLLQEGRAGPGQTHDKDGVRGHVAGARNLLEEIRVTDRGRGLKVFVHARCAVAALGPFEAVAGLVVTEGSLCFPPVF